MASICVYIKPSYKVLHMIFSFKYVHEFICMISGFLLFFFLSCMEMVEVEQNGNFLSCQPIDGICFEIDTE